MGLRDYMSRRGQQGSTSEQRAAEIAMEAAGINPNAASMEAAQAQALARRMASGDAGVRAAFASEISQWADDPEMSGRYLAALRLANEMSPGVANDIVFMARPPEAFVREFPPASAPEDTAVVSEPAEGAKRKPANRASSEYTELEKLSTYGAGKDKDIFDPETGEKIGRKTSPGLDKLVRSALETRSRRQRTEQAPDKAYNQRLAQHLANDRLARMIRDEQLGMLSQTPLAPEHVAMLTRGQLAKLTGVSPDQVDMSAAEALIGATLRPDLAKEVLTRDQVDLFTGTSSRDLSLLDSRPDIADRIGQSLAKYADSAGEAKMLAEYSRERHANLSTLEQVLAGMRSAASQGGTVQLDQLPGLRSWRYPWPTSQNQEIVRPEIAPSGEFLASVYRPLFDPQRADSSWMPTMAPVLERSVREQAASLPSSESYAGRSGAGGGQTARQYADLLLEPARDGFYLKQAEREGLMQFPQFMEGVWMNRGQQRPSLNLGGLLIDEVQSAPRPDPTISTPTEQAPMPQEQPPVMPADGDVSMYGRRYSNPELLAALLA